MIEEIINSLPYKVTEQVTFEYNRRLSEVVYLTSEKFDYYSPLREDIEVVKTLLAMSIFYKRILTNFDSANKFTSRIIFEGNADSLRLGTYDLDKIEIRKLNRIVIHFKQIMEKYSIPEKIFEYLETKEFLKKIKIWKHSLNQQNNELDGEPF